MFSQDGGATSHHSKQDCHDNSWGFSSITRRQHTNKNSDIQMSQTKWTGGKKEIAQRRMSLLKQLETLQMRQKLRIEKCVVAGGTETKH